MPSLYKVTASGNLGEGDARRPEGGIAYLGRYTGLKRVTADHATGVRLAGDLQPLRLHAHRRRQRPPTQSSRFV